MAQNQQKHLTFILVPEARMKMRKKGNQGDMKMGKSKENTYIYMYMYIYIYIIYIYIWICIYIWIYARLLGWSFLQKQLTTECPFAVFVDVSVLDV